MDKKVRNWFLIESLVLLTHPFMMVLYFHISNLEFEEAKRKHIAQFGSAEGFYGDCSGLSLIVPIIVCVYMIAFFFWSVAMFSVYKELQKRTAIICGLLILVLAVIPSLILDLLLLIRL